MEQSLTRIRDYPKLDNGMVRLLALLGASLYLGHELNIAFFVRVFSYFGITNELAVSITSFIPLILSLPLLFRKAYRVKPFIIVYGILAFLFFIGILTHLEYLDIYFRPRFGIHKVFFPSGGIFMTYYLVLFYDEEDKSDLSNMFFLGGLAIFTISMLQYGMAQTRGYWLTEGSDGSMIKINYSLIFGFNMAFAVNIFQGLWFIRKKIGFLLLSIVGYYTILTDGNRMSMFLVFAFLFLMLINAITNKVKNNKKDDNEKSKNKKHLKMVVLSIGIFICLVALGVFFESFFYQIPQEAQVANLEKNTLEKNTEELLNPKESQNIMITSIIEPEMKNGIFKEDGEYFFYLNGEKSYVGLFIKDNNYYYARPDGSLVRNLKFSITKGNNILPEGEFHFKEDGTIDKDLLEEDMEKIKNDIISNDPHSSRNLSMLKTGGLFFNNARSDIYQLVIEGIKDSPILGKGPYGDRLMTSSKYIWGHSHNIFLEILVSFGFLLGVPILLLLLNTLFALMSKKTSFYTIFYCVFLGTGSSLLTSNSFWLEPYIWGMVTIAFLTMEKDDFWFYQIFKMLARKKVIKND